jgi:hypothetical protein
MRFALLPSSRRIHGAALFLVLWAILVISVAVLVAASLVDLDLENETLAARRFLARQMALSGLAVASHPDIKSDNPLLRQSFPGDASWEVRILNENALINPNPLLAAGDFTGLRNLFSLWGLEEKQIDVAIDSLVDWIDPDEFRSLNGAEAADIPLASGWSRPENRPFLEIEEMERVRGMELVAQAAPNWADFFSIHASNLFDLQFAPADILIAFGGIDEERARRFVSLRAGEDGLEGTEDDVIFETLADAWIALGVSPGELQALGGRFALGGGLRRIESIGRSGPASYRIYSIQPSSGGRDPLARRER